MPSNCTDTRQLHTSYAGLRPESISCGSVFELTSPGCRVDAVQLGLSSLTNIPPQEQILLLNGNPLDPNKSLGVYQLPVVRLHIILTVACCPACRASLHLHACCLQACLTVKHAVMLMNAHFPLEKQVDVQHTMICIAHPLPTLHRLSM